MFRETRIKIQNTGAGVVKQTKPPPATLVSHMSSDSTLSCSTSNTASCQCAWENYGRSFKCLGLVGEREELSGSWLYSLTQPSNCSHLRNEDFSRCKVSLPLSVTRSIFIYLSYYLFIFLINNLKVF